MELKKRSVVQVIKFGSDEEWEPIEFMGESSYRNFHSMCMFDMDLSIDRENKKVIISAQSDSQCQQATYLLLGYCSERVNKVHKNEWQG